MNRKHGLLAFLCCMVALAAVAFQVPLISGVDELGRLFAGGDPQSSQPLVAALTPPSLSQIPSAPGKSKSLTLFDLQREIRADPTLAQLAKKNEIPISILKAHLAQASQGVMDGEGMYYAATPGVPDNEAGQGPQRTSQASYVLGQYRQATGSLPGALVAWTTGPQRAKRVVADKGASLEKTLDSMRTSLSAIHRTEARTWLCTVWGLSLTLKARWPVEDTDLSMREGPGVRLATSVGETIRASMPGRVGYVGPDGGRGQCVELIHACALRTEVCDLSKSLVEPGQSVKAGAALGQAGSTRPRFNLAHGGKLLDAGQLLDPYAGQAPQADSDQAPPDDKYDQVPDESGEENGQPEQDSAKPDDPTAAGSGDDVVPAAEDAP